MSDSNGIGAKIQDKKTFIRKYEELPKNIKLNQSCYAIASEW
jgi:hypothetical protein